VVEDLVAVTLLVERQLVLEPRAAAAAHGDPQSGLSVLLVREERLDLSCGYVCEGDHDTDCSRQVHRYARIDADCRGPEAAY